MRIINLRIVIVVAAFLSHMHFSYHLDMSLACKNIQSYKINIEFANFSPKILQNSAEK